MNILFLSISYSEKNHISFYEDLLQEFIKKGHKVYVTCACERKKEMVTEISNERNISVLRIKTGNITGNISLIEKGISTLLIDNLFKKAIKAFYKDIKFDIIIYPTPPITLAGTVKYIKNRCRANTYLLLKDIFPQNAVDLGMLKTSGVKGIIYNFFRNKEKKLYKISDYIGCMSKANVQYVLEHNTFLDMDKIEVCPNCIKISNVKYDKEQLADIRIKYGIPINKIVFVYGGNLGKPQGIDFFLKCLDKCRNLENAYFLIVGGGTEADKIKKFIKNNCIKNAKIIEKLPKYDYEMLTSACDVGLIFLDYRFTIPNFPSRILSYMQAAKPVIVASDPNTDIGKIVEDNGFGWSCLSKDEGEFISCVKIAVISNLKEMGAKGRQYLEKNYSVKNGYEIIMKHFVKER